MARLAARIRHAGRHAQRDLAEYIRYADDFLLDGEEFFDVLDIRIGVIVDESVRAEEVRTHAEERHTDMPIRIRLSILANGGGDVIGDGLEEAGGVEAVSEAFCRGAELKKRGGEELGLGDGIEGAAVVGLVEGECVGESKGKGQGC
jgi:hypothetical protein